ncbi:uncharacterized protein BT62DRAFT_982397 [Guyanagaster necrorhizus]|uniref:Uncharacterized protein n=1 Tax=Guyanagaster necrorhizus TaxID=856835 RepID=A0A9P7VLI8_9AGAR|nr:uncharacterized protein BT62DRAFT_982397 [Guyanagaster necrorhizus MCA 3950]KAG7442692.1 hypothetical protein BT62DRAFT_982397 [Guyanagaster necrorhizus MCA 3950]
MAPNVEAGLPTTESHVDRYNVHSTDVIQDARVNVTKEHSDTVIWYKERFLTDDEIVEHIVHNPTSKICWTIHRPKRGWYIRIRSRHFPPGVFIPLAPVSPTSPHHVDAALSFFSRTNMPYLREPEEAFTFQEGSSSLSVHSYPPTPPPPPPGSSSPSSSIKSEEYFGRNKHKPQVSEFILAPHSSQHVETTEDSTIFARAFAALRNHKPSHSNSFTLSRVAQPPVSPPPYASDPVLAPTERPKSILCPPLLVFHDRTPVYSVASFTGTIEFDRAEEGLVGVDTSFWIAVALTYLEFLAERESYLAALSD